MGADILQPASASPMKTAVPLPFLILSYLRPTVRKSVEQNLDLCLDCQPELKSPRVLGANR